VDSTRRPEVTVIVPVYNIERYLEECLDSLASQVFTDFEVVIVDDGSTDGSAVIAKRYATRSPEVFRIVTKPNGGLSDARNAGMTAARGAYFAFVDADDVVAPTFLSAMYGLARERGADLVVCGIVPFGDPKAPETYLPEPDMSVFDRCLADEPRLFYRVDASACDKLYARGLFENSGIRFPVGMAFEDVPTTYRLLGLASRVSKVDEPLYRYRQARGDSITSSYDERFLDLVNGFEIVIDFYRERGGVARYESHLLRLLLTHLIAGRYPDLLLHASAAVRRRFTERVYAMLDTFAPGWRADPACRALWPNPLLRAISTHRRLLLLFCHLPQGIYLRLLARMGSFDPAR